MPRPTDTTAYGEQLYAAMAPLAYGDSDANGWALLCWVDAIGSMFQQPETYARDQADGTPGMAILLDPQRCPPEALNWLSQWAGVDVSTMAPLAGETNDQFVTRKRSVIQAVGGRNRGRPASLVAAAQQFLTGSKTVLLRERDGGAYNLTVVTYTSETADSSKVLTALLSQKPAGILLTYATVAGATYLVIRVNYATYTAQRAAFTTYNGLRNNVPGT